MGSLCGTSSSQIAGTDLEVALIKCHFGQPPLQLQVPSLFFSSKKTKGVKKKKQKP